MKLTAVAPAVPVAKCRSLGRFAPGLCLVPAPTGRRAAGFLRTLAALAGANASPSPPLLLPPPPPPRLDYLFELMLFCLCCYFGLLWRPGWRQSAAYSILMNTFSPADLYSASIN